VDAKHALPAIRAAVFPACAARVTQRKTLGAGIEIGRAAAQNVLARLSRSPLMGCTVPVI
jgi:hypothetical protein